MCQNQGKTIHLSILYENRDENDDFWLQVYTNDGLPTGICSNCLYRLGAAYHFKKQCEDSDHRLRVYLGLIDKGYSVRDNETNTDITGPIDPSKLIDIDNDFDEKPKQKKRFECECTSMC